MLPALAVDHLTHRYGDRLALDDVSLEIATGSFVALLGPNGGGKSTLFRICATLQRPSRGTARIFGADVMRAADAARRRRGGVVQSPARAVRLCPELCIVPPDFSKYKQVSEQVMAILRSCTDLVEPQMYAHEAPQGLMMRLLQGKAPAWLQEVPFDAPATFKVWRVIG